MRQAMPLDYFPRRRAHGLQCAASLPPPTYLRGDSAADRRGLPGAPSLVTADEWRFSRLPRVRPFRREEMLGGIARSSLMRRFTISCRRRHFTRPDEDARRTLAKPMRGRAACRAATRESFSRLKLLMPYRFPFSEGAIPRHSSIPLADFLRSPKGDEEAPIMLNTSILMTSRILLPPARRLRPASRLMRYSDMPR